VAVERRLFHTKEWAALPPPEKILYLHVKARYIPGNNGKIAMPYTAMRRIEGCKSSRTISMAFAGLIEKGWLEREQLGGLYRKINTYKLTFKYDNYDGGNINKDKRGKG